MNILNLHCDIYSNRVRHELTQVSFHDVVHVIAVDSPLKLEMLAKRLAVIQHLKQTAVSAICGAVV